MRTAPTVPEDVREREAAVVVLKGKQKRKRVNDAAAVEAATVARRKVHTDRLKQKLSRGNVRRQAGYAAAEEGRNMGSGDALNWALLDEELVDF